MQISDIFFIRETWLHFLNYIPVFFLEHICEFTVASTVFVINAVTVYMVNKEE